MYVGLWVWWVWLVLRCNAMLCCWFVVGLIEEELVEEGREEMVEHRERERQSIVKGKASEYRVYYVFFVDFFFLILR